MDADHFCYISLQMLQGRTLQNHWFVKALPQCVEKLEVTSKLTFLLNIHTWQSEFGGQCFISPVGEAFFFMLYHCKILQKLFSILGWLLLYNKSITIFFFEERAFYRLNQRIVQIRRCNLLSSCRLQKVTKNLGIISQWHPPTHN